MYCAFSSLFKCQHQSMKRIIFILSLICYGHTAFSQNTVKGVVYDDLNQNGKKDRNEKGIPNVSVSNGIEVVQTNGKGEYTLPVGNDNIIFVIKPSDYIYPVNEKNLPQFYYVHKPNGSPTLKYGGVKPTGDLPKSVDFPLYFQKDKENFKAFVFGDPQPYSLEEIDFFHKDIIKDLKVTDEYQFGISLGDIAGDNLTLHQPYIDAVADAGLTWFNVMGNHDMDYDVEVDSLSDETFENHFGPNNYAFNYGNAHFIVLDNIYYPYVTERYKYIGGFRKSQLDFIENNLKFVPKDKLIVLAYHIPLIQRNVNFREEDRQRLFDLLAEYPNTVSMAAHTHYQEQLFYGKEQGWKRDKPHHEFNVGTTCGDWYSGHIKANGIPNASMRDGTPKGYAILNVKGNTYSFDYKVAGADPSYQINLSGPSIINTKYARKYTIYSNFFMGSSKDKVEYKIGNGKWKPMVYSETLDPSFVQEVLNFDLANDYVKGIRPRDPMISNHLWSIKLPKLNAGKHNVHIRATDMYGKVHFANKEITVLEN